MKMQPARRTEGRSSTTEVGGRRSEIGGRIGPASGFWLPTSEEALGFLRDDIAQRDVVLPLALVADAIFLAQVFYCDNYVAHCGDRGRRSAVRDRRSEV